MSGVVDSFQSLDARFVAAALLLHVCHHVLRALAWRNVLAAAYPHARPGLWTVAACYAAGVALNAATPARGGDAAKVVLLRTRMHGTSVATLASSMSVVLIFDTLMASTLVLSVWASGLAPQAPSLPPVPGLGPLLAVAAVAVVALLLRRLRPKLARLWADVRRGGAILRTPHRYLHQVVLVQAAAWGCRLGVVVCLLGAFGLPASVPLGAAVLVFAGVSALVPLTPGGMGAQQVLVAVALQGVATTSSAVSFSVGMQAGITAVNVVLGVGAAMLLFRTLRPLRAVRTLRSTIATRTIPAPATTSSR